ncbi:hypothetical protein [Lysobacter enzymogenes]|jgi:hypothetical protein|uniref:hypothetical protein n=1 Tax=Lysobacter enzymogenes TaxID=69 RepID=UPI00089D36BA|nr:hypothetical protein [Lysobacter enzymogenes]SDX76393.1 hypothetical protein SAMN05421681_107280 [Lysobacter enzymogenes]
MSKLKYSLLALVSAAAICGASSASAQSFELYDSAAGVWVKTGYVSFTGPTSASYLSIAVPCTATFDLYVNNGAATVINAKFTGSAACNGIVAQALPWSMTPGAPGGYTGPNPPFSGAPTLLAPLTSVAISGIRIYIPSPLNVTCPSTTTTGTINGVLDSNTANKFVFKGPLGPCSVQTQNTFALTATSPVRVVP